MGTLSMHGTFSVALLVLHKPPLTAIHSNFADGSGRREFEDQNHILCNLPETQTEDIGRVVLVISFSILVWHE